MKKFFIFCALASFAICSANSQNNDNKMFNHMSVGVQLGTTGLGFDVAAPVGKYVQVRTGVDFLPTVKVKNISADISASQSDWTKITEDAKQLNGIYYNSLTPADQQKISGFTNYLDKDLPQNLLIDGELATTNFKFLIDFYPMPSSSFHITAGFYAGKSQVADIYTTNCEDQLEALTYYNENLANTTITPAVVGAPSYTFGNKIGAQMGDYLLVPNGKQISGYIKTKGFKPYLGLGWGRAVPNKRVNFAFDLGVMFWGSPEMYVKQKEGDVKLEKDNVSGDGGKIIKTISKVSVYPVLNFRLGFRAF